MVQVTISWKRTEGPRYPENAVALPIDSTKMLRDVENIGELVAENCFDLVEDMKNNRFDYGDRIYITSKYERLGCAIISGNEVACHIKKTKKEEEKKVLDIRLLRAALKPDANNRVNFEDVVRLLANY